MFPRLLKKSDFGLDSLTFSATKVSHNVHRKRTGGLLKYRGAAQLYLKFSDKAEEFLGLMFELSSLCAGSDIDAPLGALLASPAQVYMELTRDAETTSLWAKPEVNNGGK